MGLLEFCDKHAGKLMLGGAIGLSGVIYGFSSEVKESAKTVNEIKKAVPEYVRIEKVNEDISDLKREFNREITLRDAIVLTSYESPERKNYAEMLARYESLQEEQKKLNSSPEIKKARDSLYTINGEKIIGLTALYFASFFSLGLGACGFVNRPKKQKPFLI